MTGLGMIVLYLGYAVGYWAINAFQGNPQDSFASYLFPFAPKNTGVQGVGGVGSSGSATNSTPAPAPADKKQAAKPSTARKPGIQQ